MGEQTTLECATHIVNSNIKVMKQSKQRKDHTYSHKQSTFNSILGHIACKYGHPQQKCSTCKHSLQSTSEPPLVKLRKFQEECSIALLEGNRSDKQQCKAPQLHQKVTMHHMQTGVLHFCMVQ